MCYIHMQHIFIYCPTFGREFQGLSMLGFIGVILNAGTRRHAHQLKQSVKLGQALDLSVTQCSIAQSWDSA